MTFPHQSPYNIFDSNPVRWTDPSGAAVGRQEPGEKKSIMAQSGGPDIGISSTEVVRDYVQSINSTITNGPRDPSWLSLFLAVQKADYPFIGLGGIHQGLSGSSLKGYNSLYKITYGKWHLSNYRIALGAIGEGIVYNLVLSTILETLRGEAVPGREITVKGSIQSLGANTPGFDIMVKANRPRKKGQAIIKMPIINDDGSVKNDGEGVPMRIGQIGGKALIEVKTLGINSGTVSNIKTGIGQVLGAVGPMTSPGYLVTPILAIPDDVWYAVMNNHYYPLKKDGKTIGAAKFTKGQKQQILTLKKSLEARGGGIILIQDLRTNAGMAIDQIQTDLGLKALNMHNDSSIDEYE